MNDDQNNLTDSAIKDGNAHAEVVPADQNAATAKTLQQQLQDVAAIGDKVQAAGALQVTRGLAISCQMELTKLMQVLSPQIIKLAKKQRKKPKDEATMAKLTDSFSRICFQLSQSQALLLEAEKLSPAGIPDEPKPLYRTFMPGEKAGPSGLTDSPPGV